MRTTLPRLLSFILLAGAPLISGYATERTEALNRRQDGIDSHSAARAERQKIRSDRADARSAAHFDAM